MLHKLELAKIRNKKVLGIGAHPDDLEFCASGTLMQLAKENEIVTLVVTDGCMGTHEVQDKVQVQETRRRENEEGARAMGVTRDLYWDYPDFALKSHEKNFRRKLLKFLLKERPDIVITFDPWGRYESAVHPDHRVVSWAVVEMVMAGTLPLYLKRQGLGQKFLDPKPQIWLMDPSESNVAVDITDEVEKKWSVLATHKSQFDKQVDFTKMRKWIDGTWHKPVGELIGVEYAEEFRIMEFMPEDSELT